MDEFQLPVTAGTAAILGLFFLWQTWQVINYRRVHRVLLGETDDRAFRKMIRGHGNAAEQVPIALILLGLNEMMYRGGWLVCCVAILLVAGRIAHGLYFGIHGLTWRLRMFGMLLTLISLGLSSLGLVYGLVIGWA